MKHYLFPLLSALGIASAVMLSSIKSNPVSVDTPDSLFPSSPFKNFVAAVGIIEPISGTISISSPYKDVVEKLYVKEGQKVEQGDPLFSVYSLLKKEEFELSCASVAKANAILSRLENSPRTSLLNRQQHITNAKEIALGNAKEQYQRISCIDSSFIYSEQDQSDIRTTALIKEEEFLASLQTLTEYKAGPWIFDIDVLEHEVIFAKQNANAMQEKLNRCLINAPISGTILKIHTFEGEMAGNSNSCVLEMGQINKLHVCVNVDEIEAWKIEPLARGFAFLRGAPHIQFPLTFEKIDMTVVNKQQLSGDDTERVDTRVLQVTYSFTPGELRVYPGQIVDVCIEYKGL